jgi:alpha-L-fucosidase
MSAEFGVYDSRAWHRFFEQGRSNEEAKKAAKAAEVEKQVEIMEACGDGISPYGPLMSKLVNPRLRQ